MLHSWAPVLGAAVCEVRAGRARTMDWPAWKRRSWAGNPSLGKVLWCRHGWFESFLIFALATAAVSGRAYKTLQEVRCLPKASRFMPVKQTWDFPGHSLVVGVVLDGRPAPASSSSRHTVRPAACLNCIVGARPISCPPHCVVCPYRLLRHAFFMSAEVVLCPGQDIRRRPSDDEHGLECYTARRCYDSLGRP